MIKLSDVTKALKRAGFRAIKLDLTMLDPFPPLDSKGVFFKYNGDLFIQCGKFGFGIKAKKNILPGECKYITTAVNAAGEAYETQTDIEQFFFPRLFGYLEGEITESEIIAEICNS